MLDIPVGSTWRNPSGPNGPTVIKVDSVDIAGNTVTGNSWPERDPTMVAVCALAPSDFDGFARLT